MSIRSVVRLAVHTQALPVLAGSEETLIGGQAVMEGVMMRAPHSYCVAVRKPGGELVTDQMPVPRAAERYPIFKYPVLRGIGTLGQALYLGIKALNFSANAALEDRGEGGKKQTVSPWVMGLNLAFSLAFFIFLYKFVPLYLTTKLEGWVPAIHGRIAFNLTDGVIRMLIFLLFLYGVSRWKDMRRVFEYHGAEHKVVYNYESGLPVTVENARPFTTFHPRCGTSFLLVVMVIAIGVYALIPFDSFFMKFALRVALLPLIAGLSYELIRIAAKHRGSLLGLLTTPGLWLQRITTQPPDDGQLAVAIHALDGAMALEQAQGGELVVA
ncbi:MAG: DUF1385 domain-containing protein [Bryobacterales bacterium]|nr:DUF1385 domain-containing protein [Bryobacterales bacterium]